MEENRVECITVEPGSESWPWYWSGWEDSFKNESRKTFFLTSEIIFARDEAALDAATRIFVDFFPDELTQEKWAMVEKWRAKMIFLPPLVRLEPRVGKTKPRHVFVTDGICGGLMPPTPEPISLKASGISYRPLPIEPSCFGQVFDFLRIQGLSNLSNILNAPGWVLMCCNPQSEQALYDTARRYGIKVAFWERAYTSPLRYLAGYEDPFIWYIDKNTKIRFKRVMSGSVLPKAAEHDWSLDEVVGTLNYPALGISKILVNTSFVGRIPLERIFVPENFVARFRELRIIQSLATTCLRLRKQPSLPARDAFYARAWNALVLEIFSAGENEARCWWHYSLERYPAETTLATLQILTVGLESKTYMGGVIRLILQSIICYQIKESKTKVIMNYLKNNEESWLHYGPTWSDWGTKALFDIVLGSAPADSPFSGLPEECQSDLGLKDLWICQGVMQIRRQSREKGVNSIKKELARGSMDDFGQRLALKTLFLEGDPFFEKFWDKTVRPEDAPTAAFCCLQFEGCFMGVEKWRNDHRNGLEKMAAILEKSDPRYPRGTPAGLLNKIIIGKAVEAIAAWRPDRQLYEGWQPIIMSYHLFLLGEYDLSREMLQDTGEVAVNELILAIKAALNLMLGMRDKGRALFRDLKMKNEYFWQTTFLDGPQNGNQEDKLFLVGVLGKASGDEELVSFALSQLDIPAWEPHRVGIGQVSRMPMVQSIEQEIRDWIMKDNF